MDKREFKRRRNALLSHMDGQAIAILAAAPTRTRNRDTEYPYRPSSDFFYLSGCHEPEAVLVLVPGREHGASILFCRERNAEFERWNGELLGPARAISELGFDDAFPISDIDDILPGLMEGRSRLYCSLGADEKFDRRLLDWVNRLRARVRSGATPPGEFVVLEHTLHELRLHKTSAELKVMRQAAAISAAAHVEVMEQAHPGIWEYQLEAIFSAACMRQGARFQAYPAIVGSGEKACVLHYIDNNRRTRARDLVLIDAGCELEYYASDITRTFPVAGRFTAGQQALYEVVLAAQEAAIDAARPGAHWNVPHEAAVAVLTQGLVDLGLLQGEPARLIEEEAYKKYYMHRTGHWLGLDVHDVGEYKIDGDWRLLEENMVFTVEPGLYISPDDSTVPARFRGIGIRIEDDVRITEDVPEVLTRDVPKSVSELTALVGRHATV